MEKSRRTLPLKPWQLVLVAVLALIGTAGLGGALARRGAPASPHGTVMSAREAAGVAAVPTPMKAVASPGMAPEAGPATAATAAQQPRIDKTGSLDLTVGAGRIDGDVGKAMAMATGDGGFVLSSSAQSASYGAPAQAMVTLQVPEADFEALVNQVEALGKVASLTTKAVDLTGQYVDLQAQISALQASHQQYLAIMARAKTIGNVLAVQEQLDGIDSQLQQLQDQQQLMDNETTYSTLTVTLSEKAPPPPVHHPASGMEKAWKSAVSGFVSGVEGVVRLTGPAAFALLLGGGLFLALRWAWRARRQAAPPVPKPSDVAAN